MKQEQDKGWFASKLKKEGECWIWQGYKMTSGYGKLRFRGSDSFAHRVAFILWKGEIPVRMLVCHHCDNPSCCNPEHLFVGTQKDNFRDALKKGRWNCFGAENPAAKLTNEQAVQIKLSPNVPVRTLAERYACSAAVVESIRYNRAWKHVIATGGAGDKIEKPMNLEQQRLAIAEACGWREAFPRNGPPHPETKRGGILLPYHWVNERTHERKMDIPNYLNDLNAMALAEGRLPESKVRDYLKCLKKVMRHDPDACFGLAFAKSGNRAEAFLKTMGLWREE